MLNNPFKELENIRNRLNIPLRGDIQKEALTPLELIEMQLQEEGIEVPFEDIERNGPFLGYKGFLCVLYINTPSRKPEMDLRDESINSRNPKFHVTWCKTLERMQSNNRLQRYVMSQKEVNRYKMQATEIDGSQHWVDDIKLHVCRYCLDKTEHEGFKITGTSKETKDKIVGDFVLKDYFDENQGEYSYLSQLPLKKDDNLRLNNYTDDWTTVSRRQKELAQWTCTKCKVNLSSYKRGIQTHHKNGMRYDNVSSNLQVLCALCHKTIDEYHSHMYVNPKDERMIKLLRRQQNIKV
ncbi:MAG: hypothetical protein ACJ0BP_00955 [Gammaproteobacteria bacterium]